MKFVYAFFTGFLLTLISFSSHAQTEPISVQGSVRDKQTSEALLGTRVMLLQVGDSSIVTGANTDEQGAFKLLVAPGRYILKATLFTYKDYFKVVTISETVNNLPVVMESDAKVLDGVLVETKAIRVEQKGDTTQYNADAFKTNPDATVEDLVTKMPGISIENGVVKAQGQDIKRVLIDGEEFFGDDATAALKNLPAEIVSKIQVYDFESDQARFTGISEGNDTKALNIVTKPGKNQGQFGKIYAGYGWKDLYLIGGNVNFFKGSSKVSVIAMSNNVNQQNFSSEDILGVSGTAATSSTGGQGRRPQGGGGGENFMVGQQSGVSTTHSIGINYSDKWKKTKVTGSYFFNATNTNNTQKTGREYIISSQSGQFYQEDFKTLVTNSNHRVNFRFDIELDSLNSLVITPKFSYQGNTNNRTTLGATADQYQMMINSIDNTTYRDMGGFNGGTSVLWRHKFMKPRRTFSVNLSGNYSNRSGMNGQESMSIFYDPLLGDSLRAINQFADNLTNGLTTSARFSYTEPLSNTWSSEFNYTPSLNQSNNDKRTYNYDAVTGLYSVMDTTLSNVFQNRTIGNDVGSTFRFVKEKTNLQLGVNYQNNILLNDQEFPLNRNVKLVFHNILPNVRYKYDFTKSKSVMVNYRANTRTPSIDQLQNVVDNSNPLSLSSGNEFLKQQYNHRIFSRFNLTNVEKGSNFFVFLSGELASNYITNSTFIAAQDTVIENGIALARGSQYRKPVNLDGNWSTRGYASYGIPISKLKVNLNFNAGAGFGVTPGLINNEINKVQTTNVNAGLVIASNVSKDIDFTVSYAFNFNNASNSRQNNANNQYFVQNIAARFNWIIKDRLVLNTNFTMNAYDGLGSDFNQVISLWNAGIGYKILKDKSLELRISAFDILNKNNSIVRNVTESYIEDVESRVLNRYFMFTATYNLRNFGGKTSTK